MPAAMARTKSAARPSRKPMSAIAGPGHRPTSPQPTPKRSDPPMRRASIALAVGQWKGSPERLAARRAAMRKATNAMAIAPPMTKASEGSQAPPRSRNASTLLGLVMPERHRPIPNRRPTKKGETRFMMRPSEDVADEEDRQKACAHEGRRRRERAWGEAGEAADAVSAGAAVGEPRAEADQQAAGDQGRGGGLD